MNETRLTKDEFDLLYELAHSACEGMGPCLREDAGEALLKLLNEQAAPKESD